MKKKANKLIKQFPNIFRFITEFKILIINKKNKPIIYLTFLISIIVSIVITLVIIYFTFSLYVNFNNMVGIIEQRQIVKNKLYYWKAVSEKYNGYKDSYFQLAVYYYQLNNYKKSREANNKALLLDPNFYEAKKLKMLLSKSSF